MSVPRETATGDVVVDWVLLVVVGVPLAVVIVVLTPLAWLHESLIDVVQRLARWRSRR